jgi:hypothetical protein
VDFTLVYKHSLSLQLAQESRRKGYRQHREEYERVALLACQAYLFEQKSQIQALKEVDQALYHLLSIPYFDRILIQTRQQFSVVAFSPDKQWLASGSYDGTIRLWRLDDLGSDSSQDLPRKSHGEKIASIAFSPTGKKLAVGYCDRTVEVWELNRSSDQPIQLSDPKRDRLTPRAKPDYGGPGAVAFVL